MAGAKKYYRHCINASGDKEKRDGWEGENSDSLTKKKISLKL